MVLSVFIELIVLSLIEFWVSKYLVYIRHKYIVNNHFLVLFSKISLAVKIMDQKLDELEQILTQLQKIPTRTKSSAELSLTPVIYTQESINAEDDIQQKENLLNINELNELKIEKRSLIEKIANFEEQINTLNRQNFELKNREKRLRNDLLDIKGSIRVFCRLKPSEQNNKIEFDETNIKIDNKNFIVNRIFDQKTKQSDVFDEMNLYIKSILDGYKVCVFAYGQTGSGKTYTMEGIEEDKGLIYRSISEIEKSAAELILDGFTIEYKVKYLEIYNETIKDLLSNEFVTIVHESTGIKLKNCSEIDCKRLIDLESLIHRASLRRTTGETMCNQQSSRSHSVFILSVILSSGTEKREGSLSLIDLAGSERLNESKAENERLKETQSINKSLSALGNVFNSLKRKDKHVPFRDSKLTHLMQEYLTGKSRTTMIVNINPENLNESICSLRFASKVGECELGNVEKSVFKQG